MELRGTHLRLTSDKNWHNYKNLNTELMLIDKINLYFKSSKQLDSIKFSNEDKLFVDLVDSCKTFKDVIEAAKKLSDWQKKQNVY